MCHAQILLVVGLFAISTSIAHGQSRLDKVLGDRERVLRDGNWLYNDLPTALSEAKAAKKPLLVVLRCIPCEQCVKLDDEIIEQHPDIKPLLDDFICARVVSTNGLDLATFQFDTDQSFAIFFLNADGTIYGRYGTRSHRTEWERDVSVDGLAAAMKGALALHREYPENKEQLAGKRAAKVDYSSPEQYPALKDKYKSKLEFSSTVVQSCIHCHQIGDAQRQELRAAQEPMPLATLFQYPHPKSLGLIFDPTSLATVLRVEDNSPAAASGFQAGDKVESLQGQPLLSIADVQWVLHNTPAEATKLEAQVARGTSALKLDLELPADWRQRDDISWRASTWNLRRMVTGGLVLERVPDDQRDALGLDSSAMALQVKHVGQYGAHAAAKQAGFQKDDIVVAFDGRSDFVREADLITYALQERKSGERVEVRVLRGGKNIALSLPMQP